MSSWTAKSKKARRVTGRSVERECWMVAICCYTTRVPPLGPRDHGGGDARGACGG
jgi:hypothetical protein